MPDPMTEYVNVRLPKATAERIDLHQQLSTRELSDMREACRQALQQPVEGKPTGTIFELDLFRERLERLASAYHGKDFPSQVSSSGVGRELAERAAELKTLIDNCTEQYVTQPKNGEN